MTNILCVYTSCAAVDTHRVHNSHTIKVRVYVTHPLLYVALYSIHFGNNTLRCPLFRDYLTWT